MSSENIICYKTSEGPHSCPITDISFVEIGTEALNGEVVLPLSDEVSIMYSKKFDGLPIISTLVETDVPCSEDCEIDPRQIPIAGYSLSDYDFLKQSGLGYRDASTTLMNHADWGALNFSMRRVVP